MITSKIKEIMVERGFSVRGLAALIPITEVTIMRARGPLIRQCRLETLETIAGALGVKTKDLYEEE